MPRSALRHGSRAQALTTNRFGLVRLLILASEVVLTAGVAIAHGERYSLREIAGLALIVAGVAVVFAHGQAEPAPRAAATPPAVIGAAWSQTARLTRPPGWRRTRPAISRSRRAAATAAAGCGEVADQGVLGDRAWGRGGRAAGPSRPSGGAAAGAGAVRGGAAGARGGRRPGPRRRRRRSGRGSRRRGSAGCSRRRGRPSGCPGPPSPRGPGRGRCGR